MYKSSIKYFTLFSSIMAFILGCVIMFMPADASLVINYMLVIMLGIIGIAKICRYASSKHNTVWDLIAGILYLVACMILLANDALVMSTTVVYIIAMLAIIDGISHFVLAYDIRQHFKKISITNLVLSGILAVLLGVCLLMAPLFTQILYVYIIGVTLVVFGLAGFISGLCMDVKGKK